MTLTPTDLALLDAASRTLLSPLLAPDVDAWIVEAGVRVRDLLGADVFLATPPSPSRFYSLSPDAPQIVNVAAQIADISEGELSYHDPVFAASQQHVARSETSTWEQSRRVVERAGYRMEDSLFVSEAVLGSGLRDLATLHIQTPAGLPSIVAMSERRGGLRFGEGAADVLRLLAPAFRAGLDAVAGLAAHRAALGAAIDAVAGPALAFDADGRVLHRNAALVALLDADPERAAVECELTRLSGDLRRLAFPRGLVSVAPPAPMQRTAATARGRYTLSAALVPSGAFGPDESAFVSVAFAEDPGATAARAAAAAGLQFGLTRREAEVALLLTEGLTNATIAERLFVSPHTARHHVENVLAKLGLTSRAAVAGRLVQAA